MRLYIDSDGFRKRHSKAYEKWAQAEKLLFGPEPDQNLTTVGHRCREAMQAFATDLVDTYNPPDVEQDKAKSIHRLRAALDAAQIQSSRLRKYLYALVGFFEAASGLAQRQTHGEERERMNSVNTVASNGTPPSAPVFLS